MDDHVAGDCRGELLDLFDHYLDGLIDAALDGHGVGARGQGTNAFAVDRLGQNRGSGGAVAGDVGGFGRHFADQLGAEVFERVLQLDFFGDRHAVLGDARSAELLLDHDIAALGAQGDLDGVRQLVDPAKNRLSAVLAIDDLFCHK